MNTDRYGYPTSGEYTTINYVSPEAVDAGAVGLSVAAGIILALIGILFIVGAYVISAIFLGRIFKKAGVPSWIAWVPFYNTWKLLEIGGQQGFWAVLAIIPFVNIASAVFIYIAMYHIGLKLGKSQAFVVLGIFLQFVWLIWLGADNSKWNEKAPGAAPSLHQPTHTATS